MINNARYQAYKVVRNLLLRVVQERHAVPTQRGFTAYADTTAELIKILEHYDRAMKAMEESRKNGNV